MEAVAMPACRRQRSSMQRVAVWISSVEMSANSALTPQQDVARAGQQPFVEGVNGERRTTLASAARLGFVEGEDCAHHGRAWTGAERLLLGLSDPLDGQGMVVQVHRREVQQGRLEELAQLRPTTAQHADRSLEDALGRAEVIEERERDGVRERHLRVPDGIGGEASASRRSSTAPGITALCSATPSRRSSSARSIWVVGSASARWR
jgi:hypothetical protein